MGGGEKFPDIIREVTLPVVSNRQCARDWSQFSVVPEKLCTKVPEGDKTVCQGDSGGSLSWVSPQGEFQLIGITSYVMNGCINGLGVFTRVTEYLSWIEEKTGKTQE